MGKEQKRDLTEIEKYLIEDYFNDKLTPAGLQKFQELMKSEQFADWVDKYRQATLWLDSIAEQELIKDLEFDSQSLNENEIQKAFANYPLLMKKFRQMKTRKKE